MIIDSHCHLDYPVLYDNLEQVVNRAIANEIKYLLSISTSIDSFNKIKLIISKYENIYGTLGIHPHETKNYSNIDVNYLKNLYKNTKKIIGIGETGLDYYYNHSDKEIQKKSFIEHIKTSIDLNLPVIVHTRNADKDTYDILLKEKGNSNLKILIHCFTGSKEFAKKLLDIGSYISISGIVTFKNSNDLIEAINIIPNDRLLVETDSPYLAPMPFRGKSNEPSYIIHTLEKLSEIKKISKQNLSKITSDNFLKIFNIN